MKIISLLIVSILLSSCTSLNYGAGKAYMDPDIGVGVTGQA